jgi:hypothetical protein
MLPALPIHPLVHPLAVLTVVEAHVFKVRAQVVSKITFFPSISVTQAKADQSLFVGAVFYFGQMICRCAIADGRDGGAWTNGDLVLLARFELWEERAINLHEDSTVDAAITAFAFEL